MLDMSHDAGHIHSRAGTGPGFLPMYICSQAPGGKPAELAETRRLVFAAMASPRRDLCVLAPGR